MLLGLSDWERNERGDKWVKWCEVNNQIIANSWLRHHPKYLWTWKSPGDLHRNQIDYIVINSITQGKTYPGAGCGSDHVPGVASMKLKFKKIKQKTIKPSIDLQRLKLDEIQKAYAADVKNRFDVLYCDDAAEDQWTRLESALNEAADTVLPK